MYSGTIIFIFGTQGKAFPVCASSMSAWICVETNLYIVSKYPVSGLKGTDNYYWKYLSPKDAQQFPLKKPNPSISESDKIKISDLLKQIDTALRNNK